MTRWLLAGVLACFAPVASAATITRTYTVTSTYQAGAPVTRAVNRYTITFDPTARAANIPVASLGRFSCWSAIVPASQARLV